MKGVRTLLLDVLLFILGVFVLWYYAIYLDLDPKKFIGVHRVIIALAAAMVSIGLPGTLQIGKPEEMQAKNVKPEVNAAGALAVFVLVYLFNPIG